MKTVKTSISLPKEIWETIKNRQNKSSVVATALIFYLDYEKNVKKAEQEYWKNVERSLRGENGEYAVINPKGKKITDEDLENTLWK